MTNHVAFISRKDDIAIHRHEMPGLSVKYVYALPHERSQGEQQGRKRRAEVGANAGNSRSDRLRLDWIFHPRFIPRLKSYFHCFYCYDRLLPVYGSQRETRLGALSRQLHWILAKFVRYIIQLEMVSTKHLSETYRDGLSPAWLCAASRSQDASKMDPSYPRTPFPVVGDALEVPLSRGHKKHLIPFCPFFFSKIMTPRSFSISQLT
jgi:hypothetical protein